MLQVNPSIYKNLIWPLVGGGGVGGVGKGIGRYARGSKGGSGWDLFRFANECQSREEIFRCLVGRIEKAVFYLTLENLH